MNGLPSSRENVARKWWYHEDVAVARAQRRSFQRYHVQAIEEVLAEPARWDLRERIAIGRADDAHVRLVAAGPPRPAGRFSLQEAQQLRLESDVHLGHFIEEQRSPVGLERSAFAVRNRAAESALRVPEYLALHKLLRDRRTIDRDERTVPPFAELVQRLRAQFLADA